MLLLGAMKERHKKYSKLDNEAPWSKLINDSCFSLLYFWIYFVNFFNQDTCQNIETDIKQLHIWQNWDLKKMLKRLIIWLDHATTDNNCSKHDKDIVNYGAFQCLESRRHGMETDMRKLLVRRNEIQENVCQLLR